MFKNLKQKIGESLESSPARNLLPVAQAKSENLAESPRSETGSINKNGQPVALDNSLATLENHATHGNIKWPHGIVNDLPIEEESDPDVTSLGLDALLELYSTTHQQKKLYQSKCAKLFSAYGDLHAECNRLKQDVDHSSTVQSSDECNSLRERIQNLEAMLNRCKETLRTSKKQVLQSKEERDSMEKQLQTKSAECIVLQAQREEFKKKLSEAKKLVAQSDTNVALAIAETKRSLHGAIEAKDDELERCREALKMADLKNGELVETLNRVEKSGCEQIKHLESIIENSRINKESVEAPNESLPSDESSASQNTLLNDESSASQNTLPNDESSASQNTLPNDESSASQNIGMPTQVVDSKVLDAAPRRGLGKVILAQLSQLGESFYGGSVLPKESYLELFEGLRRNINQAWVIDESSPEESDEKWKIAKLEEVAIEAKVKVLRHEGEIIELNQKIYESQAEAAASQMIYKKHITCLEEKLMELSKREQLAKEQLELTQNEEKLRSAVHDEEVKALRAGIECAHKSEALLQRALEETKMRCEQQIAECTAENMSTLGQLTEFLQYNQSELFNLMSELAESREQLSEMNDQLDERTNQLDDALNHIADMELSLMNSTSNEAKLSEMLKQLGFEQISSEPKPELSPCIEAPHSASISNHEVLESGVSVSDEGWPARGLSKWYCELGKFLTVSDNISEATFSSEPQECKAIDAQCSGLLIQVENCKRRYRPEWMRKIQEIPELGDLFNSPLLRELEVLRKQLGEQSEELRRTEEIVRIVSAENEFLKTRLSTNDLDNDNIAIQTDRQLKSAIVSEALSGSEVPSSGVEVPSSGTPSSVVEQSLSSVVDYVITTTSPSEVFYSADAVDSGDNLMAGCGTLDQVLVTSCVISDCQTEDGLDSAPSNSTGSTNVGESLLGDLESRSCELIKVEAEALNLGQLSSEEDHAQACCIELRTRSDELSCVQHKFNTLLESVEVRNKELLNVLTAISELQKASYEVGNQSAGQQLDNLSVQSDDATLQIEGENNNLERVNSLRVRDFDNSKDLVNDGEINVINTCSETDHGSEESPDKLTNLEEQLLMKDDGHKTKSDKPISFDEVIQLMKANLSNFGDRLLCLSSELRDKRNALLLVEKEKFSLHEIVGELKTQLESARFELAANEEISKPVIEAARLEMAASEEILKPEIEAARLEISANKEISKPDIEVARLEMAASEENTKQEIKLLSEKLKDADFLDLRSKEEALVKMSELEGEIAQLKREVFCQTEDRKRFEKSNQLLCDEIQQKTSEIDNNTKQIQTLSEECTLLQHRLNGVINELHDSRGKLEAMKVQRDELLSTADTDGKSAAELEIRKKELLEKENTINALDSRVAELRLEIESKDAMLTSVRQDESKSRTLLDVQVKRLESDLSAVRIESNVLRETHEATVTEFLSRIHQYEDETNESAKRIAELVANQEAIEDRYRERISNMEHSDVELNAQLVAVTVKLNSITEYTSNSEKVIEEYRFKTDDLTSRIQETERQLAAAESACSDKDKDTAAQLERLRDQLTAERDALIAVKVAEVIELRARIEEMKVSTAAREEERNLTVASETSGKDINDWESEVEATVIQFSPENLTGLENSDDGRTCVAQLQSEIAKLSERLMDQEMVINDLNRRHDHEVNQLRTEHHAAVKEMEEQHNTKTIQLIKDFNTQLARQEQELTGLVKNSSDCCKKLESRLLTEHKQQMADVGRHLRDRDSLIQQFESDIQAAEAGHHSELSELQKVIDDLQRQLNEQQASVVENETVVQPIQSSALSYSAPYYDQMSERSRESSVESSLDGLLQAKHVENSDLRSKIAQQADEIRWWKNRERQISSFQSSKSPSPQYSSSEGSLPEPTELEYLKNILFKYMLGTETKTLAKVICTVVKFSEDQTRKVLDCEESKNTKLSVWSSMLYAGVQAPSSSNRHSPDLVSAPPKRVQRTRNPVRKSATPPRQDYTPPVYL